MNNPSSNTCNDELLRDAIEGDESVPERLLRQCIKVLTLFKGTLSPAASRSLYEAARELFWGLQFILDNTQAEDNVINQLAAEITEKQDSLKKHQDELEEYRRTLKLLASDVEGTKLEIEQLKCLADYEEMRSCVIGKIEERKEYQTVLSSMAGRALEKTKQLKDLETECVLALEGQEALLSTNLEQEEEKWRTRESNKASKRLNG